MHSSSSASLDEGVEWERYPIYAPTGSGVTQQHLVRFLAQLPIVHNKTPAAAPAAASAATNGATPTTAAATAAPKLQFPFSSATRLCTPRHVDYRSKFIHRKKLMKTAVTPAQATSAAGKAGGGGGATKEAEEEGVDPTERKWRLEDPKQARENSLVYLGSRDQVPRKEIHQQAANHYAMLVRQEGKFLLVPVETYSFRHTDNDDRMTLEEAEQKMKSRVKRFEKRVRNMATLQQHHDEEDAAAGLTNNATAAEGGGGGNAASALALERARPMGITKTQTEKVEKADDAFADTPAVRSKAGALARAAKKKREEGADYTRQFDDDDIDGNDDRLDGQGAEASDRESDDEEALVAAQQEAEEDALVTERKKKAALQKKAGMTFDEAEEEVEWAETADDNPEEENEDEDPSSKKDASNVKRAKKEDDSDEEYDDSDLSLDDESDEEKEGGEVKVKPEPAPAVAAAASAAAMQQNRKRPVSPATTIAPKKVKTEGGAAAAASSGAGGAAAAPAAPLNPAEVAEIERLVIQELLAAPAGQPYSSKSLAQHLNRKMPDKFNRRTAPALRDALKKVVSILPDKTHIILKKEYQK